MDELNELAKPGTTVIAPYDQTLERLLARDKKLRLDDTKTELICNKIFSLVLQKKTCYNYKECETIMDIIERNKK